MKKSVIILAILAISMMAKAQQEVALHSNGTIQHFGGGYGLINACNAATSGDTIYLSSRVAEGIFYGPNEINKTLTIYGAGHYPDSTLATGRTLVSGDIVLKENADSCVFEGIYFTGSLSIASNEAVDNFVIRYCRANTITISGNKSNPSKNIHFYNNVLGAIDFANAQDHKVENCILQGEIKNTNGGLFYNNIIFIQEYMYHIKGNNNFFVNNVITSLNSDPNLICSGQQNNFSHTILTATNPNFGTYPTASNNYTGVAANNIFVNQTGKSFNYAHDYHLKNPESYVAGGGTQIGIYGGAYPYKEGAVQSNPHIQEQIIAPATNNGQLNIQIKAAAQDK